MFYVFAKGMNLKIDFEAGMKNITFLRDAVDVVQHHDAITGTEKHRVAESYMDQMHDGTQHVHHWDESVIGQFLKGPLGLEPVLKRSDMIQSEILSQVTTTKCMVMVAFNSLAWNVTELLQIPTNRSDLVIYNSTQNVIPSQINPVIDGVEQNSKYPAKFNLYILAQDMAPLSFETYFICQSTLENPPSIGKVVPLTPGKSFNVGMGYYSITIDGTTNRLSSITNNQLEQTFLVENQFSQYTPSGGWFDDGYQPSGAYIFRPTTDNRLRLQTNNDGKLQNEVFTAAFRQNFTSLHPSPGFIVQTHSNYGLPVLDVFAATVCGFNLTSNSSAIPSTFQYQYYRVDRPVNMTNGTTWGQRPLFDFLVLDHNDPTNSQIVRGQQSGFVIVNKSATSTATSIITFPEKMNNNPPALFVSVRTPKCLGTHFATTITGLSSSGATVSIKRIDTNNGTNAPWLSDVYLDWLAFNMKEVNDESETTTVMSGEHKVEGALAETIIPIEKEDNSQPRFLVNEPVCFTSNAMLDDDSVESKSAMTNLKGNPILNHCASTTYNSTNTSFVMNFNCTEPEQKNGQKTRIIWLCTLPKVLIHNVTSDLKINNTLIEGPLVSEVQQVFKKKGSIYAQKFGLFNVDHPDLRYIDNRVIIGPIDKAAEFITKYSTDMDSKGEMFTNQAGLEYVKRVYNPFLDEPVAGNYYPSSGATYIEDGKRGVRFSTIVNQGHGVASLRNGEMEMMLQRRCVADDRRGVNEVLNERYHTEPQIMIMLDTEENVANLNRRYYQIQQFQHSFFFGITDSIVSYISQYKTSWSAMNDAMASGLPPNVFLMQFRFAYSGSSVGRDGGVIMQMQHMFENGESSMAKEETVDLTKILKPEILTVQNASEMNLLATIPLADLDRLPWNISDAKGQVFEIRTAEVEEKRREIQRVKDSSPIKQMLPREIKTFVLNVDPDVRTDAVSSQ